MAHAILSASSASRWMACPPSAIAAQAYENTSSVYAQEGTLAHEIAYELCVPLMESPSLTASDVSAHEKTVAQKHACEELFGKEMLDYGAQYRDYIEELLGTGSVLLLEQRLDFSSYVPDGFGTGDAVILSDKVLNIIDYKYGMGVPVSAKENKQMMCYAIGAIETYGFIFDFDTIRMTIFQPRINNISSFEMSVSDLLHWAETELKPKAELASKGEGVMHAGEHCRFCSHGGVCATLAEACQMMLPNIYGDQVAIKKLADHEIVEIWRKRSFILTWLDKVKAHIEATLLSGGELEGLKMVEGKQIRSFDDQEAVIQSLLDAGFAEKDFMTLPELLSVSKLEKALGKKDFKKHLDAHIVKKSSGPTIAFADDPRPAIDRSADFDFDNN